MTFPVAVIASNAKQSSLRAGVTGLLRLRLAMTAMCHAMEKFQY